MSDKKARYWACWAEDYEYYIEHDKHRRRPSPFQEVKLCGVIQRVFIDEVGTYSNEKAESEDFYENEESLAANAFVHHLINLEYDNLSRIRSASVVIIKDENNKITRVEIDINYSVQAMVLKQ